MKVGKLVLTALVPLVLAVAAACGNDDAPEPPLQQPTSVPVEQAAPTSVPPQPTARPTETPVERADVTPGPRAVQVALASTDLSIGSNRLAFALIDDLSGPLRDAQVEVQSFRMTSEGPQGPVETTMAILRTWPVGPGSIYTARLSFDTQGLWGIAFAVVDADGNIRPGSVRVEVKETSATPLVGSPAPRSASKTSRDVDSLDELTTDPDPDPDLYSITIAEALDLGMPLMVSFATPAYCQTATCGPQLDVIKDLKGQYGDRMSFIHVEVYDNPHEIEGDLTRAILSPTITEWNLPTEPWTFIVDAEGRVQAKFEAFVTREELEEALQGVLP